MLLPDVNILVYAFRSDSNDHDGYRDWLAAMVAGESAYGCADQVLSGFIRVVTHPRIFAVPSPLTEALHFAEEIRGQPHCLRVAPGVRHWSLFHRLCDAAGARGNLVPDAYLAALAIESGCEWVTTDRDYSRFPGLRWRHPLQ